MTERGEAADSLGQRLRTARKAKGLSQDELARRVGVEGRRQIIRWESDENVPEPENQEALTRELDLPDDFFPTKAAGVAEDVFAASYLGRILRRLEAEPDLLPQVRAELLELSGALAALAARLRQVAEQPDDEQRSG